MASIERVITYVDGLNLYHGIRDAQLDRFQWLDVTMLAKSVLREEQSLVGTKYFVARFSEKYDLEAARSQSIHLRALETIDLLDIFEGRFQTLISRCHNCAHEWPRHEEKMTDVNIAVELVLDAEDDLFDTALLITADADLTGPIHRLRNRHPSKRFIVAFPPSRVSSGLKKAADGFVRVGRSALRASQLPDQVQTDGGVLVRPTEWSVG